MSVNHLGKIEFAPGSGFALGFSVLEDVGARGTPGSVGELGWGGAYHSVYWIDPLEDMVVVDLTQLIPAGNVDDLVTARVLVYPALVDELGDVMSIRHAVAAGGAGADRE
jgi:CubicO group peptidase (beta-lactamase class C family)